MPSLLIVSDGGNFRNQFVAVNGVPSVVLNASNDEVKILSWGSVMQWYSQDGAEGQVNYKGRTNYYIAIG